MTDPQRYHHASSMRGGPHRIPDPLVRASSDAMTREIFISHAGDDRQFVDRFVQDIIEGACGLTEQDYFYSSRRSTGLQTGRDLNAELRAVVQDAMLVIAILTPRFFESPWCMAELGAAWGKGDIVRNKVNQSVLLPVLAPNFTRDELAGVLGSITIRSIDDEDEINAIADAISTLVPRKTSLKKYGERRRDWLRDVKKLARRLPTATAVDAAAYESIRGKLAEARSERDARDDEISVLKTKLKEVAALKDRTAVNKAMLSKVLSERFEELLDDVQGTMRRLFNDAVRELVRLICAGEDVREGDLDNDSVRDAGKYGEIIDVPGEAPTLGRHRKVEDAVTAVKALTDFLDAVTNGDSGADEDEEEGFASWFDEEYSGLPMDLRQQAVWDAVVGRAFR